MPQVPKKTRLCFHIQLFLVGGIEKVLLELLQALPEERYEISLIITHHVGELEVLKSQIPSHVTVHYLLRSPVLNWAKRKKMTSRINVVQKVLSELFLPPFQKKVIRKRLQELTSGADVCIDFDMTLGAFYNSIRATRKVVYCHFSLAHYWKGNPRKLSIIAKRLEQYDRIIMLCDEMKEDAARLYPFLKPKLARLYNALDLDRIKSLAAAPLTGFEAFENKSFFLSVGRLEESQKDFTTLIKAYGKCVRDHAITEPLVIVGFGNFEKRLKQLAQDEGVRQQTFFTGFQSNPYSWMARAKLFLFSSKFEGLPTVLLEALSLERPIIATACPTGVKEILMNGDAGVLVPVGNVEAMSDAIISLKDDESRKQEFREASKEILQQFDIRFMIAEFERIVVDGK